MRPTPLRILEGAPGLYASRYGDGSEAVLLVPPLAEERKGVLRPLSDLARRLAGDGWTALLFDYRGTGESPGNFEETTWEDLSADIRAAANEACKLTGSQRLHVVATRTGARIALDALPPEQIAGMVLWEPILTPATWLREIRRRSRFRGGGATLDPLDVDGYRFNPALAETLEGLDALPPAVGFPTLVACVARGGKAPRPMHLAAEALGAEIAPVIEEAFWLETGVVNATPLLEQTAAWLDARRTLTS